VARTLASRILTLDQFKTLLTTLSMDLARVSDYLTLLGNLATAQSGHDGEGRLRTSSTDIAASLRLLQTNTALKRSG